jgi:hypothetical protein
VLRKALLTAATALIALLCVSAAARSSTPHFPVVGFLGDDTDQCFFNTNGEHPTSDFGSYQETYAVPHFSFTLTDQGLACLGSAGVKQTSHVEGATKSCDENAPLLSGFEEATFADGAEALVCDLPDLRAERGGAFTDRGNSDQFVAQGFTCAVTVLSGNGSGQTEQLSTPDSIEFDAPYLNENGHPVAAVTTACVGKLPQGVDAEGDSSFACQQTNPFQPGTVAGTGTTFVFPDRHFEQICRIPVLKRPA